MFWMNVDFPEKCCTVHKQYCSFILQNETDKKGIGQNLEDGGWHQFASLSEANEKYEKSYSQLKYKKCKKCF
ncbi:hypothetical protein V1499_06965 [Neobacillus sp. SCS-31]|uniref:hypothetical protein n=1 Tax=Neobacillus oceani TaxID=3115292 RepID=UPI003906C0A0